MRTTLSIGGLLALSFLCMAAPSQEPEPGGTLPSDEAALQRYAEERMNQGAWREADRAFKAFLQKFPEAKNAEHVMGQLGNLHHWHSNRYAEAREWYEKLCMKFPKSPSYWHYRLQSAQTWGHQNLRQRASEEMMKISRETKDPDIRVNAIQQAWSYKDKYFHLYVRQSFTAGQTPEINVQARNVDKVVYRATHIKYESILRHLGPADGGNLGQAIDKVGPEGRTALKEWVVEYPKDANWRTETVEVPSTASGIYLVEGEHDGLVMKVTVIVSRHGLVTKSAAGKLVAFAQDRATSRPVGGMEIRTLHAEKPLRGTTDAQGLFVADGFKGGVVIGVKDGEIVTTDSHYWERPGESPLTYVTTDRPIYRPGQKVHFRIVRRIEQGNDLLVRPGEKLWAEIRDPKGNKIYDRFLAVNDFGSAAGEIVLGDEPALGEYTVLTRGEKDSPDLHQHSWQWMWTEPGMPMIYGKFRVDEYRKPEYKVDVAFRKATALQGEEVEASIEANYYFGSPVADAEVQYTVHRRDQWNEWRTCCRYYDWYSQEDEEEDDHRFRRSTRRG